METGPKKKSGRELDKKESSESSLKNCVPEFHLCSSCPFRDFIRELALKAGKRRYADCKRYENAGNGGK